MSTSSKNVKGFYKQKKNNTTGTGFTKSKSSTTSGSDIAQPPALVTHSASLGLKDDLNEEEQVLRQFDMNMAYGPCIGITRLDRWERAKRWGLNPPPEIEFLLKTGDVKLQSLFDARI